jgi:precorrin-2 dehydrogenase/sirohydrochlorin ferrochelatase
MTAAMPHLDYPVCLRLQGRRVVVVGGGAVALGRTHGLLACGAVVTVVAPRAHDELLALAHAGALTYVARGVVDEDLDGAALVMSATDDADVTAAVARAARARGVWLNAADVPDFCDLTLPAVARRGAVTVAVSTGGQAPAVARRLRDALALAVPARAGRLIWLVRALRRALPAGPARMTFIRNVVDGPIGGALLSGDRVARRAAFGALRAALEHT